MAAPHTNGSFSYKTIHPLIKGILDSRSRLNNTVQVGMPFIKATTTVKIPEYLGNDNVGFTLGMHAIPEDVKAEDIYSNQKGSALIGYTYTIDGKTQRVYADSNSEAVEIGRLFENDVNLYSSTDSSFIPPPGITAVTVGRNKNGLLASADIQFSVPTLTQLEVLHRTFLIPGVGMVLEWGQQYAQDGNEDFGERGITGPITEKIMFPWYDRDKLIPLLERLGKNQVGLDEILKCYVWPTQGQYMWMFGKVTNFSTKANSDGSFNCSVKIVGPSEDAWAYSTRNTIIPPRDNSGKICPDGANSVESYFTTTSTGLNLKTLLEKVMSSDPGKHAAWKKHVLKFDKGNKKEGEPKPNETTAPNASEMSFGDSEDAYFMSWRFFVNIVLNDADDGILAIFKRGYLTQDELAKISLLRPYEGGAEPYIDDPYENYVGSNLYLRSVDPSTMIVVNESAVRLAAADLSRNRPGLEEELVKETELSLKFKSQGAFYPLTLGAEVSTDRGLLSTGVWINHKAVVQALASSDTILRGIINLLDRMNAASLGYWQLTVDASDPSSPFSCVTPEESPAAPTTMNYTVVDVNYKESSLYAVKNFLQQVHVFNKYVRTKDGQLVGSDVLECNVDLDLPKRMFSQIATLGLVQPQDVQSVNGGEGAPDSPIVGGDANDTLRKMFAITTISSDDPTRRGPDITVPSKLEREVALQNATCGGVGGQTTAGTAGAGNRTAPTVITDANTRTNEDLQELKDKAKKQLETDLCKKCTAPPTGSVPVSSDLPAANRNYCSTLSGNEKRFCEIAVTEGISNPIELAQLLAQFKHESQLRPVAEVLAYNGSFLFKNFPKTARRTWGFESVEDSATVCCGRNPEALANRIYGSRMGNTAPGDGWKYRGRGMVQLTGKSNYRSVGSAIGVDLVNNPDLLLNFDVATKASVHFWKDRVRPAVRRNAATYADTTVVTRAINGGEIGIADRKANFSRFLRLFGLEAGAAAPQAGPESPQMVTAECLPCKQAQDTIAQTTTQIETNTKYDQGKDKVVREFPGLEDVFRYIEPYGELMVANIAKDADGTKSNAFGASPGTLSISADITLPGVNGLRVGELFWVDRVPAFYKAFGAFQILSIEDTIGVDGWKTRINAKFNYLGTKWKEATTKILTGRA